jgi:hypothetical protein
VSITDSPRFPGLPGRKNQSSLPFCKLELKNLLLKSASTPKPALMIGVVICAVALKARNNNIGRSVFIDQGFR